MADESTYIDSSALVKLVLDEPESEVLAQSIAREHRLITSWLSSVEVVRAIRVGNPAFEAQAEQVLSTCTRLAVTHEVLRTAQQLAGPALRTIDAIHLATARRARARRVIAYDRRLIAAAEEAGVEVLSPA